MFPLKNLISIIIPTFNRSHLIGETVESVIKQTYQNWECIVVDDGSSDYTEELMEFYLAIDTRIKFHLRPKAMVRGANSCRNFGFKLSQGNYIKWLDSDDILMSDYLEEKFQILKASSPDLVICDAAYFTDKTEAPKVIFKNFSTKDDLLINYLTGKININTQSVLYKSNFVENIRFNDSLCRAQELDFNFRLLKSRKYNVEFVNKTLVLIRGHSDSITGEYYAGNLKSIKAELYVRRNTLRYILKKTKSDQMINSALQLYLPGLRSLYKNKYFKELLKELQVLESDIDLKGNFKKWKIKFLILVFIYSVSGRDYRLEKHLFSLKF